MSILSRHLISLYENFFRISEFPLRIKNLFFFFNMALLVVSLCFCRLNIKEKAQSHLALKLINKVGYESEYYFFWLKKKQRVAGPFPFWLINWLCRQHQKRISEKDLGNVASEYLSLICIIFGCGMVQNCWLECIHFCFSLL